MTTIRGTCPDCGEVELKPDDLRLLVCQQDASKSHYAFTCPKCLKLVRKPADDKVCALLLSGGVQAEVWHIPDEALESHSGPMISYDDLLTFALRLKQEDYLAALLYPGKV